MLIDCNSFSLLLQVMHETRETYGSFYEHSFVDYLVLDMQFVKRIVGEAIVFTYNYFLSFFLFDDLLSGKLKVVRTWPCEVIEAQNFSFKKR